MDDKVFEIRKKATERKVKWMCERYGINKSQAKEIIKEQLCTLHDYAKDWADVGIDNYDLDGILDEISVVNGL